jgi:hypothetical protein
MKRLAAVLAALAIAACATTGTPVYREQYQQAVVGKTTGQDLVAIFGPPTMVMRGSDGRVTELHWEWSYTEVKGESFIPFANLAGVAGQKGTKNKVQARLDTAGVLADLSHGGTYIDTSGGSIFQGYEVTGKTAALTGLPGRNDGKSVSIGAKCKYYGDCLEPDSPFRCAIQPGKDYGYCIGTNQAK